MKLAKLTKFLDKLDGADLHYTLASVQESAVTVGVTVPGEHWQIEFMADGDVEVEIFRSDGEVHGASALGQLFDRSSSDDE